MKKKTQDVKAVNPPAPAKAQIEVKLVKHTFTAEECDELGMTLARAHAALNDINGEFEQVKGNFKARLLEQEATIGRASSARLAGFEMRNARCRVEFRPQEREKDYFLEFAGPKDKPVLVEPMTDKDMQATLLPEEPKFEAKEEIRLWESPDNEPAVMTVGRLTEELLGKKTPMWFAALNVCIDGQALVEKLDNNQPCATKRIDILRRAAKRLKTWLIGAVGKESAKGFDDQIDSAIEAQKERVE